MKLKKASILTKLVFLILAVYATVTLLALQSRIQQARDETESLQAQIEAVTRENSRLTAEIQNVGTQQGLEEVARSKLGYVYDGEIIFQDIGD